MSWDWKKFTEQCPQDTPFAWCVDLVSKFGVDHEIIFMTGRVEQLRSVTLEWLSKYLSFLPDYELLMRSEFDVRHDSDVKKDLYETLVAPFYDVLFVLEDRNSVVEMWRSLGLVCLQCQDGDF